MPIEYLALYAQKRASKPLRKLQHIKEPAWHPLSRPLHKMRVALIPSGAIREGGQRRFPHLGDASYRKVSSDPAITDLHIDHRSRYGTHARKDPETVFPRRALWSLADQGVIGSVGPYHFSIYGGIALYREIEEKLAPALARQLARGRVDLAVLIPY